MSIFARREIQKRINRIAPIVGKRKLNQFLEALNIDGNKLNEKRIIECLAKAWEVAIVSAFVEMGDTKHEKKISNGRRPDVYYCDSTRPLIADVFAVYLMTSSTRRIRRINFHSSS